MQVELEVNQNYTITLTGAEIGTIQNSLLEIPAKFANPLMNKIASQLSPTEIKTDEKVED